MYFRREMLKRMAQPSFKESRLYDKYGKYMVEVGMGIGFQLVKDYLQPATVLLLMCPSLAYILSIPEYLRSVTCMTEMLSDVKVIFVIIKK